ncbi:FAD/NAD(P)-binding protein [Patescibacteria group bacterium]|nr:FAD/NAD(P)-binding protein [Patescibacteria group bacterium]
MRNPYQPKIAIIKKIKLQAAGVKLFTLSFKNKKDQLEFTPGQFIEVGVQGFGEAPFAICSSPQEADFQVCVRQVGSLTSRLHTLRVKDLITVRGPYGNGFPQIKDKNLLLIAGGLGIIPLRPLILSAVKKPAYRTGRPACRPAPPELQRGEQVGRTKKIQVFYGARSIKELLFRDEYKAWQKSVDLARTLDKGDSAWKGRVGLITTLFDDIRIIDNAVAIVCGPQIMYKFVIQKLKESKFADTDIFFSLERKMYCGFGVCQHCAIGSKYVCKDGPVFNYDELKSIRGAI